MVVLLTISPPSNRVHTSSSGTARDTGGLGSSPQSSLEFHPSELRNCSSTVRLEFLGLKRKTYPMIGE
jgi:hypothetical protein